MATATLTGNKASLLSSTTVIARRTFLKFIRTPQLVVVGTVQGAMFLLIFRYVFGGAIQAGGVSYVKFLVPGFITTGIIWQGMMSAGGIAEDLDQGFFDRLRSLPIPRAAVLTGRALADTGSQVWGLTIMTIIGFAIGFRLGGSVANGILAFALIVLFSFAFEWVFTGTQSGELVASVRVKPTEKPVGVSGLSLVWLTPDRHSQEHAVTITHGRSMRS